MGPNFNNEQVSEMKAALIAALMLMMSLSSPGQTPESPASATDRLAREIAGDSGSSLQRTRKLVEWINQNLAWSATDYQQRTPEEIIGRRGGNCAELARVLARLLAPANIRYRWAAEINLQPYSAQRQQSAEQLVKRTGLRGSVFGARHNDHRWLEIYDDAASTWVPADPAMGVVGVQEWIKMRLALQDRPAPPLPATAEIARSMIVPFVVVVLPKEKSESPEDRTEFYLIDQFNAAYGGKLASLPAWIEWTGAVRRLSRVAIDAFQGRANLHDRSEEIRQLSDIFEQLRQQAKEHRL